MFIDSHTHLDHCEEDVVELLADAREADVGLIIQAGTDLTRSRWSVEVAEQHPEVVATVGFHPHEAGLATVEQMAAVEQLAAHPRVIALGETGFDFFHDFWPHEVQEETFVRHLELAKAADLPVVIHTRDAAELTLSVLAEHASGMIVVLHCFSLPDRLEEVVERGYYVSFAGNVTYKKAEELQAAAANVPDHLILLETDAPWLSPMPLRGRPNRPALVAKTYQFVADLRGMDVNELAARIEMNVRAAFPRLAALAGSV
jgi:TatD DNase family protein